MGGKASDAAGLRIADDPFATGWDSLPDALEESFRTLVRGGPLPLEGTDVTRAVLHRIAAFYVAQQRMKAFLGKHYAVAAADFFVETVVFYLKVLAVTHELDVEIASERQIKRARGSIRPDISIWRDDHCLVAIECKTQLGWKRQTWEAQFLEREQRLIAEYTGASTFLLVLTGLNWGGFGESPDLGIKYFLLLKDRWPTNIDFENLDTAIGTPIEGLFAAVRRLGMQSD